MRRCFARTRAEVAERVLGVRAGLGSCQPAPRLPSPLPPPRPLHTAPDRTGRRKDSTVSLLLSAAHIYSCPSETHGKVATGVMGAG